MHEIKHTFGAFYLLFVSYRQGTWAQVLSRTQTRDVAVM